MLSGGRCVTDPLHLMPQKAENEQDLGSYNFVEMTERVTTSREDPAINSNALHDFHKVRRGPRNVPDMIRALNDRQSMAKDAGHPYAKTEHISFEYFDQRTSNASSGYEHYVSLPPAYGADAARSWPLILFLHGAGESQRGANESYASVRHGIPKLILCYDRLKDGKDPPSIDVPLTPRSRKAKQAKQGDKSAEPVPAELCTFVAENFITVTPSLNMEWGYGWNSSILSALLDEIIQRYRVDLDRIHVTGFSMGGYGTWDLALYTPNRFASLMPICGGGDPVRARQIKHIPQWVHHGDLDDTIPLRASQQMVEALEKAGADVRFTRYPDLPHDSWSTAFSNLEVYQWMSGCKRTTKGDDIVVPETNKSTALE